MSVVSVLISATPYHQSFRFCTQPPTAVTGKHSSVFEAQGAAGSCVHDAPHGACDVVKGQLTRDFVCVFLRCNADCFWPELPVLDQTTLVSSLELVVSLSAVSGVLSSRGEL